MNPTQEQWLPVVGYEGLYEVSDQGRVRSLTRIVRSKTGQTYEVRGKVMKASPRDYDYPRFTVSREGRSRVMLLHRAVLEAFVGPCPDGMEACHNNGDKADARLENLRWDTPKANSADMRKHGRVYQLKVTHCPSGHEYSPENIYLYEGRRYCRSCRAGGRRKSAA